MGRLKFSEVPVQVKMTITVVDLNLLGSFFSKTTLLSHMSLFFSHLYHSQQKGITGPVVEGNQKPTPLL